MTRPHAVRSIEGGIQIFQADAACGARIIGLGEMGIGNSTCAAAMVAAFTGLPAEAVTGRGTGVDDTRWAAKMQAVARSIAVNRPDAADPLDVLAKVGGYEIGGLAGVILAAAAARTPVVVDGFICSAAALVAVGIEPRARDFLIAGHVSPEPGHRVAIECLGLKPLLDFGMRLGEGTGAALALGIIDGAVRLLNEMATFAEARVSDGTQRLREKDACGRFSPPSVC